MKFVYSHSDTVSKSIRIFLSGIFRSARSSVSRFLKRYGAAHIVDPAPYLTGSLKETFAAYPHLERVLPAMGYGSSQVRDLEETIDRTDCDLVLCATPIDLTRVLTLNKPALRVRYAYRDHGSPTLFDLVQQRLDPLLQGP